ncbi:MAG: hypothetical protein QOH08_2528 [Chloroflexota bacterium]|jgi:hypothetical protein|nr:hypothetical protein [Chloroflexota bacterium]
MIIDPEPPDPPRRRWPFLVAWSVAAIAVALALFLAQHPSLRSTVDAAEPPSDIVRPVRRVDPPAVPGFIVPFRISDPRPSEPTRGVPVLLELPGTYVNYAGQRIAVGLLDDLMTGGGATPSVPH